MARLRSSLPSSAILASFALHVALVFVGQVYLTNKQPSIAQAPSPTMDIELLTIESPPRQDETPTTASEPAPSVLKPLFSNPEPPARPRIPRMRTRPSAPEGAAKAPAQSPMLKLDLELSAHDLHATPQNTRSPTKGESSLRSGVGTAQPPREGACAGEVSAPRVLRQPRAIEYVADARMRGVEGRLVLSVEIDREGTIRDVQVITALDPILDAEAVRAVKTWTFAPAMRCGQASAGLYTLARRFKLEP